MFTRRLPTLLPLTLVTIVLIGGSISAAVARARGACAPQRSPCPPAGDPSAPRPLGGQGSKDGPPAGRRVDVLAPQNAQPGQPRLPAVRRQRSGLQRRRDASLHRQHGG